MIDKKILISIVIVLIIGVAAASYQITTKTPGVWQPSVLQAQTAMNKDLQQIHHHRVRHKQDHNLYQHQQPQVKVEVEDIV